MTEHQPRSSDIASIAQEPALNGADYRAVVRLSTADDVTLAEAEETCERVPVHSLRALWLAGWIRPISETPTPTVPEQSVLDTTKKPRRRATDGEGGR